MLLREQMDIIEKHTRQAPVTIIALARELGLRVYTSTSLKNEISGLIKKDKEKGGENGYAIFVNARHSEGRRRFTIAHEIAHFILHKSYIGDGIVEDALLRAEGFTNSLERQANAMAADILMPRALIEKARAEGMIQISTLAEKFNVSKDAMSYHIFGIPYEEAVLRGEK